MGVVIPIDEVREKIISAVENMKKQITDLTDDYQKEIELNSVAWKEYGSELCANEMVANERKIFEKIAGVQKILDLLNDFLAGKISFSETEVLRTTDHSCTLIIKEHEAIIREHENKRAQIKERLENIALLWSFLQ